jgi:hypothetical protein
MRTISSIRTAALVAAVVTTDTKRILDAVHAGADLEGRQS